MSFEGAKDAPYRLVDCPERGQVLVASRDLLPGTEIFQEERSLLSFYLPGEGDPSPWEFVLMGYSAYLHDLAEEQKRRFLALYGPVTGWQANHLRVYGGALQHCTEESLKTYVKVSSIIKQNKLNTHIGEGVHIYELVSRATHSCIPNCEAVCAKKLGKRIVMRAIRPVKKGERLTRAHDNYYRTEPTHERRKAYLEKYDFTCHCPRCDAEADDTREFDCFDPQCPGSHFACQPRKKESPELFIYNYTGVEYVEPHLLPCTVCHSAPPLKYQEDMFALEKELPSIIDDSVRNAKPSIAYLQSVLGVHHPRNHALAILMLTVKSQAAHGVARHLGLCFDEVEAISREHMRLLEHLNFYPNEDTADMLMTVATSMMEHAQPTPGMVQIAKECAEKALRCQLLIHGRDTRVKEVQATLQKVLQCLPPQPATTTECMFCGEFPLRAAITLSKCGRCKQVTYCSAGCQKAHWPLHKKECCKG